MILSQVPLAIENVSKSYGTLRALKDVSLQLEPGEIFGLIGLNGAGKTTLIKLVLDLAAADSGSVHIFGIPSLQVESRRGISYLPERFQPSRQLKGMEFLSLSLSYYNKRLDQESARAYAQSLDLDAGKLEDKVGSYSKGMGQKLGLVGAFLVDMPLLILDEPMSGLDPKARILLKDRLLRLREAGKTVFFSSHILSDIEEICDRIGVIHQGELRFTGKPSEFVARYNGASLERAFLESIAA